MKVIVNENGMRVLQNDEGLFSGAGVRCCFEKTEIIFYSNTAKYDEQQALKDIQEWVESKGGHHTKSGWSTKTQWWKLWTVPIKIDDLINNA